MNIKIKMQLFDRQNLALMILEILRNLADYIDQKAFSGCMCGYGIYTSLEIVLLDFVLFTDWLQ